MKKSLTGLTIGAAALAGTLAFRGAFAADAKPTVVLVGHSYGGSVISAAAAGASNVKALVYVAAFAPEAGDTAVGLSSKFPGSTLGPMLAPH